MPWPFHLLVFSYGSLLCLGESTVYRSGVQRDVPISSLVAAGCVPCYEAAYGSVSESQDITSCTGPYLFVGTQKGDKQVLAVGALGSVEVLRAEASRSAPYLSNGVYWHYMKGCSFGFMAVESDDKSIKEEGRESIVSTNHGVSWRIGQSVGCGRSGTGTGTYYDELTTHSIVDTSSWTKHVHNCPGA
jgi:hypothetical protein